MRLTAGNALTLWSDDILCIGNMQATGEYCVQKRTIGTEGMSAGLAALAAAPPHVRAGLVVDFDNVHPAGMDDPGV